MSGTSITQQPTTLNAIASGTVNIAQGNELLTVGIRDGTAIIGTVNSRPSERILFFFS